MTTIFTKIIQGDIPSYKIYEDDDFLVFLDAFPSMIGQTLVIPKKHIGGYLFDFEDNDYVSLLSMGKKVAKAIDSALGAKRTGLVVEGLEVDHVHLRLYPLMDRGITLKPMENKPNSVEMQEICDKISAELSK